MVGAYLSSHSVALFSNGERNGIHASIGFYHELIETKSEKETNKYDRKNETFEFMYRNNHRKRWI